MSDLKGVVMVSAGFHPYIGGAEKQARSVAARLRKKGFWVWVATREMPGQPDEEQIDGFPVRRLSGTGPVGFGISLFLHLLNNRSDYSAIHVHLASSHAVPAALAAKLLRKRVVVKLGGGAGIGEIATSQDNFWGRLKLKALGALKPLLVAPNADILAEVKGSPLGKLPHALIPNGVDLEHYRPPTPEEKKALRKALGWGDGFALLSASRLAEDKGVASLLADFLMEWGATSAEHENAKLYIVGTGPKEAALKEKAKTMHAKVVFLGARHDLDKLYMAADAFLLPSKGEGLSNALLEAMASGLPIVATGVTGTNQIIKDGENGLLYHPGDLEGMEEVMKRLLNEPELRAKLGAAARATAEQYSLEKTVQSWLKLYKGEPLA